MSVALMWIAIVAYGGLVMLNLLRIVFYRELRP